MAGITRRKCSKCGEDLGWLESDPCDMCFDDEELELDGQEAQEGVRDTREQTTVE